MENDKLEIEERLDPHGIHGEPEKAEGNGAEEGAVRPVEPQELGDLAGGLSKTGPDEPIKLPEI